MTFGAARDLSSQVVVIPMTSFGMLMNSPGSELQRISPQKRALDGKSFSVNLYYESRALADSGTYLTSAGCLAIWLGFTSDFPGNPELRLVLSQV